MTEQRPDRDPADDETGLPPVTDEQIHAIAEEWGLDEPTTDYLKHGPHPIFDEPLDDQDGDDRA